MLPIRIKFKNTKSMVFLSIGIIAVVLLSIIFINFNSKKTITATNNSASNNHISVISSTSLSKTLSSQVKIVSTDSVAYISDNLKGRALPTNKIWSSVVFSGDLKGLFAYPIASKRVNDGSLAISAPNQTEISNIVTSTIDGQDFFISGPKSIDKTFLESYSDLTSTFSFRDNTNSTIFNTTFIQGSPYVFIKPEASISVLTINKGVFNIISENNRLTLENKQKKFGVFTNGNINIQNDSITINFDKVSNPYLTLGLYINTSDYDKLKAYSQNFISSINSVITENSSDFTTNYIINYSNDSKGSSTILGLLPNQYDSQINNYNPLYSIDTLRGKQIMIPIQDKLSFSTKKQLLNTDIPYIGDNNEKKQIEDLLTKDTNSTLQPVGTSYFGGKELARIARLIDIADSINDTVNKTKLINILRNELQNWYNYSDSKTEKFFEYDNTNGGLIAQKAEFGSDQYNDHHFHYGYFLYASSILSKYDKDFYNKYKDFIDLISLDILNTDRNNSMFPYVRNFDFYEGHSWASGYQPFADGNNQESTSEAINAWYSEWLWSNISNNSSLKIMSSYLYSSEVNSANYYWLNRSNSGFVLPQGYNYPTASLIWGGKYEYNTFFTTDPITISAIQYLPITSGSLYLYNNNYVKRDQLVLNQYKTNTTTALKDYEIMYFETIDGLKNIDMSKLNTFNIDNGNSLTNLYYWGVFWDHIKKSDTTDSINIKKNLTN